ncbi:hypothetical protein [Thermohalobacter berrensis]|uniref:Uncharacterized protein n=1 Tax=Thermohalobacter berrensis TaxID=99594 RepID=A0A419T8D6_9FIRM|nr:hypothetical protein [Thermohalobacter berrensis]RKD33741.1 hypothetical protein BET03_08430 [Thermohalobacter berrensis]
MKLKYYITALMSSIALLFYFFPWIYDMHKGLDFWEISLSWFMYAWILLPIHIFFSIRLKLRNNSNWKHHLISAILILITYIILYIAIYIGIIVHV